MKTTNTSSDYVAHGLIRAMARHRMCDLPQAVAELNWWLARTFAETVCKIILYVYRHRLWIFNNGR